MVGSEIIPSTSETSGNPRTRFPGVYRVERPDEPSWCRSAGIPGVAQKKTMDSWPFGETTADARTLCQNKGVSVRHPASTANDGARGTGYLAVRRVAAAEGLSAGGLRGASIKTSLRLPVDLLGDHRGRRRRGHTGRSRDVLLGMPGGERGGEGLIPVLAGGVEGFGSGCEFL